MKQNNEVVKLNQLEIIGLTGGTGSGKSVVSAFLMKKRAFVINCDEIAHQILEIGQPAYHEIIAHFGNNIIDDKKRIIRKRLGDIVFSDKKKLGFLNFCTHKYIVMKVKEEIEKIQKAPESYSCIVIDAPLLKEANLDSMCDKIWVVYAKEEVRVKRIMDRDGLTYEQAKNRIQNQKPWEEYEKMADIIFYNTKDLLFLREQLDKVMETIKK